MTINLVCVLFVLWGLSVDGNIFPMGSYGTLKECKVVENRVNSGNVLAGTCLPFGLDPRG